MRIPNDHELVRHFKLHPGDSVRTPKDSLGLFTHFGVYIGELEDGGHYVCENTPQTGVTLTRLVNFIRHARAVSVTRFTGPDWQRQGVVKRALKRVGRQYDLLRYNCEHFANDVTKGVKVSDQVRLASGVVLLLAAIWFLPKVIKK